MNSNKKNILFVEYCPDLKGGGAQRVFLDLMNSINKEKYNIFAAFPNIINSQLDAEIPSDAIRFHYDSKSPKKNKNKILSYLLFIIFTPINAFLGAFWINRHEIAIVYVHSIISGFHFSIAKYFVDFKLIYHEHNLASQRPAMSFWRFMFDFVNTHSDMIIANSHATSLSIKEYGTDENKIFVVHNGIYLENFDDKFSESKGIARLGLIKNHTQIIVGMVGHFRPWKGQHYFIESIKNAQNYNNNIHYIIVGGFHDQQYYQDVCEYIELEGLSDKVTITGHQENIPELMACMDIVVVPSVPEPFGLVVLEAMMMKKPVIAFNVGGPSEIIQHGRTGILVSEIESEALGDEIGILSNDPLMRERMGLNGRELLNSKFTCTVQAKNIENVLETLFI